MIVAVGARQPADFAGPPGGFLPTEPYPMLTLIPRESGAYLARLVGHWEAFVFARWQTGRCGTSAPAVPVAG
jgi:hypothetical protein